MHLYGKNVQNFKRLLLWNLWANFAQISYEASLGWGEWKIAKMVVGSLTKMAAMPIYGKNR